MRDEKRFKNKIGDVWVSDLEVCKSAAGYYIGRMCWNEEFNGFEEPYSRESGYMTEEEARKGLKTRNFEVRDCVENNHAYSTDLPHPTRS